MKNHNSSKIAQIFSKSDMKNGLSLFTKEEIEAIEKLITEQNGEYYIKCQIRNQQILATPEEIVRQLWIYKLINEYRYPRERIYVEREVHMGSRIVGSADIVVLHDDLQNPYIIFEIKRPAIRQGLEQLKSYCNLTGAPIGVWSNGNEMKIFHRTDDSFKVIPRIPKKGEKLQDILTEERTIEWLEKHDKLKLGETTLKRIVLELEEHVLGNAGVDPFEEILKLIYAKLYDEWSGISNPSYKLQFFAENRSPNEVKDAIEELLDGAKKEWPGVIDPTDGIKLRDEHLKVCVSILEKIKLFNSNLQIIDEAFEYLIPQVSKKKEGQFFTPRPVIDMIVKMLNPKATEFVIDPACGSGGFLLHSVMWIQRKSLDDTVVKDFAQRKIYGIDFSEKAVKIAKAINLIIGNGESHIYKDNALAPHTWTDETRADLTKLLLEFEDPQKNRENQKNLTYFRFDVLMTNPPFAGTVKEKQILKLYELAKKNGKLVDQIDRHILFLERCLQFIKPGGRMAIVLPQGLLNNTNAEYIRRFIIDKARVLAVVGLHVNTFKPHTGTKTSVLFLRKYTDEERAKYESEWEGFLNDLKEKYKNLQWDSKVNEKEIPEELKSFLETYFESREEIKGLPTEDTEAEKVEGTMEQEKKGKKPLAVLVQQLTKLKKVLDEKEKELKNTDAISIRKNKLRKEIRTLQSKISELEKEISQRTLAGQISLVLNEERITEAFKKYWLDRKIDYPIFFAVNEKPVKDESGEYRYDHDLDEIAEEFINFAKDQLAKGDNHFDFIKDEDSESSQEEEKG